MPSRSKNPEHSADPGKTNPEKEPGAGPGPAVSHVGRGGADEGIDRKREAVSWTATITGATGKFILTAAGEQVAFVVFGACLQQ